MLLIFGCGAVSAELEEGWKWPAPSHPGVEPWLWDLKLFGRLQWQYAWVEGEDSNGGNFDYQTDEGRRFYLGGQARFLHAFEVSGRAVLAADGRPSGGKMDWGYQQLWDLGVKMDLAEVVALPDDRGLKVGYGKKQLNVSDEWHTSSKFIKTVERSAIANKVWPYTEGFANPTGGWVEAKTGEWKGTLGVFSTDHSAEFSEWDDGILYYGEVTRTFAEAGPCLPDLVNLAGFWQDTDRDDERLAGGIEWAASLAGHWAGERWSVRGNLLVGDNGIQAPDREGTFWGAVVMPTVWLIPAKLEGVARYQYQGAEEAQGIRIWSRYARRADAIGAADLGTGAGRGDRHHSAYLGLNYYLHGDRLKLMGGVQYDDLAERGETVYAGWTGFFAVRTFF